MLIESLEPRQMLAGTSVDSSGVLQITGTNGVEKVKITQSTFQGFPTVDIDYNGTLERHYLSAVTANKIYFNALGGDDYCRNDVPTLRLEAWGGEGTDTFLGDAGNDLLVGGNGNDKIYGFGGNDTLRGDLDAASGIDTIDGGDGDDSIWGGPMSDYLYGGKGNDRLYGEDGNDTIYGSDGDDRIWGGSGHDAIYGEVGKDVLYGEAGRDRLDGGVYDDTIFGGDDLDHLYGGLGADILDGQAGNDAVYGGPQFDRMYGGDGDDFMDGEEDGASYYGGKGNDVQADKLVINGISKSDIFQTGSTSCWYLATLGAFADRTSSAAANYITYLSNGNYQVRVYSKATAAWTNQIIAFEGGVSSHGGDAQIQATADTTLDTSPCEGESWATIMHRGMLASYSIDYTSATSVANANFGYGSGAGGVALDAFWLLGVTTGTFESPVKSTTKADTSFISRMRTLLMRTSPAQPMLVSCFGSHPKMINAHNYQIVAISTTGTVTMRNPWGRDGGTIEGANDGLVTLTALEFTSIMKDVTYTTSVVSA